MRTRSLKTIVTVPFASYLTLNTIVTLKSGLEVTQDYWNWPRRISWRCLMLVKLEW